MNKLAWTMATALAATMPLIGSLAAADAGVSVWIGGGCCYPHHHYYPGWGRPVYMAPPPVFYGPPVVYGAPPPVAYPAPPVAYAVPPGSVQASPASPVFTDPAGRTCREYQSTVRVGGARQPSYGTACLMPDGSWRIMN